MKRSKGQCPAQLFCVFLGDGRFGLSHIERKEKTGVRIDHHLLPLRMSKTPLPGRTLSPYTFFIHARCSFASKRRRFFSFGGEAAGVRWASGTPLLVISTCWPSLSQRD